MFGTTILISTGKSATPNDSVGLIFYLLLPIRSIWEFLEKSCLKSY